MVDQTWEVAFATLVNGLPETVALPRTSDAGAVPVAAWRRDRFGVVLVVRRWRNGALAHDLVPSWRDASGEWESSVYGGSLLSGPPDDPPPPPVRAGTIEWINESSTEFYAEDDSDETTTMRMLLGEAAGDVHRLRIRTPEGDEYEHPVHHPPGLVVIGVLGTRPALVTVLDTQGQAQSSRRV